MQTPSELDYYDKNMAPIDSSSARTKLTLPPRKKKELKKLRKLAEKEFTPKHLKIPFVNKEKLREYLEYKKLMEEFSDFE